MIQGWEWDETLFAGAAAYYGRGRVPDPPGLERTLARALELDGTGRLLDVGCGPGTLALRLSGLFAEVVGVDPDPEMLAEAERGARVSGAGGGAGTGTRTRWVRARAEQLPLDLGSFDVATFGRSFHWMDRDLVAATVRGMLAPGGAFVQVADQKSEVRRTAGLPHPGMPEDEISALVREYLGRERRAGRGVLAHGTPGDEAAVLARAGYQGPERLIVPGGRPLERSQDDVVAAVYSVSYSAPHLFGERLAEFDEDLRALLRRTSPTGLFSEVEPSSEIFVWRTPR